MARKLLFCFNNKLQTLCFFNKTNVFLKLKSTYFFVFQRNDIDRFTHELS